VRGDREKREVNRMPSTAAESRNQLLKRAHDYQRLRVRFAKLGKGRFLSHLELLTLFNRAIKRARIPVRFSEGFHPLPRVTFGPALPVGIESEYEYVDIEMTGSKNCLDVSSALNLALPDWIRIREVDEISLKCAALSDSIADVKYLATLNRVNNKIFSNNDYIEAKLHNYYEEISRPVFIKGKSGMAQIDLKQWLEKIVLKDGAALEMVVKMMGSRTIRPLEILKSIIGLSDDETHTVSVKKVGVNFSKTFF